MTTEEKVECAHLTMESCGTCLEMREIAREALHNCSEEHK